MNRFSKLWLMLLLVLGWNITADASSHREAPLIANDPLADNTDVYAFRSPDNPNTITIIANYIPAQLPHGGPNYYQFGENVRYEIHVDNDASVPGDEITYRFTFTKTNEDPTTFFNIRLGAENLKTTYTLERSMDGGASFETIITDGVVPPYNIGPRSIEGGAGLNTTYDALFQNAITTASTGETVFAGPTDDPFFVDLGGIFDLGDAPRQGGEPRDGIACLNVSTIAIQVPITSLLKEGAPATPTSILDADWVIGVWASASRQQIKTLSAGGVDYSGDFVQVSRLGMPLTNEAVIPIGQKDFWNAISPYEEISETTLDQYFFNPELALYMDDDLFGGAVPAFAPLRIQTASLAGLLGEGFPGFDFSNGADGLFGLKGNPVLAGTALDDAVFGTLLLPGPGMPRSVDLWPIFHTGVPAVVPYHLATGKEGNPLAAGKPFIHNFLPNGGDMLRLNMAVPPTPRDSEDFNSLGLIQAAVLGLLDPRFNGSTDIQNIPNMDGFPNGRRLEDDVTRIELQAVGGAVLAAVGLWYDDFDPATGNPVTEDLLGVLTYSTGVEANDAPFTNTFPYVPMPWSGTGKCSGQAPGVDDGGNGNDMTADLEINLSVDRTTYDIYVPITYTVTLTNNGPLDATNISVNAGFPEGLVNTSNSTDKGTYNLFFEQWDIASLASGETATLTLVQFPLINNTDIRMYVEVTSVDQDDPDSTPGNGDGVNANEDDEATVVSTPANPEPMGGVTSDLSVALDVDTEVFDIYTNHTYTVTLTNDGPDVAANIQVSVPINDGLAHTSNVPSVGNYNLFFERWEVPTLASGETATLSLTLFTLTNDSNLTEFVEVIAVDQEDPDSTPNNGNGMTPTEDDEAVVTITPSGNIVNDENALKVISSNIPYVSINKLYPVPARNLIFATVETQEARSLDVVIFDTYGKVVLQQQRSLNEGFNKLEFDISSLPSGGYYISIPTANSAMLQKRFVVIKE